jgi:two-component system OmpR family sensor kinase
MVVLVAVGLGVFGLVSYSLYSHSQYQAVDRELVGSAPFLATYTQDRANGTRYDNDPDPRRFGGGGGGNRGTALAAGSFVELRSAAGTVLATGNGAGNLGPCSGSCPKPVLPPVLLPGPGGASRMLTVPSTDGSTSFRVLVRSLGSFTAPPPGPSGQPGGDPDAPSTVSTSASSGPAGPTGSSAPATTVPGQPTSARGDILVAAVPLGNVTSSLHRLIITDLAVGGGVLVLLSISGLLVVRRGLRPLERMAGTARAIAGGDLSRRARPADGRGEVGQLGAAFNSMMSNIQEAFEERDATEARLRQFLADVSHELRTPLTSIRGYAELYRIGAASSADDLARAMDRIETHALEMGGLVEELLLLARLDQRRSPERVDVDLAEIAAECCSDLAVTAPGRELTFDAAESVHVVGDPAHLRQAVANLLTNARRHTPEDSAVEVSVHGEGGVASVVVRDHGPGLREEGLAHAFDRFWRADSSRRGNGFGLGLSIVAAVASEHGGSAQVANARDGGAVFTIRLPMPAEPPPSGGRRSETQRDLMARPAESEKARSH